MGNGNKGMISYSPTGASPTIAVPRTHLSSGSGGGGCGGVSGGGGGGGLTSLEGMQLAYFWFYQQSTVYFEYWVYILISNLIYQSFHFIFTLSLFINFYSF